MQFFWQIIINFLKWIWQLLNFIRHLIMNFLLISLILIIIGYWIHINNNLEEKYSWHGGALLLDITGLIVDKPLTQGGYNTVRQLFNFTTQNIQRNSLFDIINVINQAKEDHNITGIVLDLKNFSGADQPSMQYIGKALHAFRESGKPIISIGDNYSQSQYYIASFANEIWLSPQGTVDLHGFSTNSLYYKSLLNKLKITTYVFRKGTYKSAVEKFTRDDMSQTSREENSLLIQELWKNYLSTIAINRNISIQQVFPNPRIMLNNLRKKGGDTAQYALDNKLVDKLRTNTDVIKELSKQFGLKKDNISYRSISIYDYIKKNKKLFSEVDNTIAVIFVDGEIINGKEISGNTSSTAISTQIRKARFDHKVKAIILRVNSPGGSVHASEVIREELAAARADGKPIVVSMGGVAASGGYWISTPANYIIASPSTLTGSIGVFGITHTIENALDYLGIHTDGVVTSPLADKTITKELPPEILQMIQINIERCYRRFITLVAQSRKKTIEQIEQIAQGHVWTGKNAKINGLIDELGDFDDAVNKAVELSKLKKWHIVFYQSKQSIFNKVIESIFSIIQIALLKTGEENIPKSIITEIYNLGIIDKKFITLGDPQNQYALCLSCSNLL